MTVRLVGLGNALRGDDAAGLDVARRVAARAGAAIEVRTCSGGAAALLDAWDGADEVVLVDAARSGRAAGTVRWLTREEAAAARLGAGTHDAGLADALALAEALGRTPPRVRVCVLEGGDFSLGAPLSPQVAAAVGAVADHLVEQLVNGPRAGVP